MGPCEEKLGILTVFPLPLLAATQGAKLACNPFRSKTQLFSFSSSSSLSSSFEKLSGDAVGPSGALGRPSLTDGCLVLGAVGTCEAGQQTLDTADRAPGREVASPSDSWQL